MLNDAGFFVEDCVLFRLAPNSWLFVHGGGAGHELLVQAVQGRNCAMVFDDDLHDMSLQGPNAVELLSRHVPGIRDLPYFGHMQTTLFGKPVMISRTGYTVRSLCVGRDVRLGAESPSRLTHPVSRASAATSSS